MLPAPGAFSPTRKSDIIHEMQKHQESSESKFKNNYFHHNYRVEFYYILALLLIAIKISGELALNIN